eukprot:GHUV01025382.1.p1 GENE.GHUV01025382.1~~GHUV01025382.1.p1  ORF type:complete len:414 (+),score=120.11 GHUV01025382.1:206-1447(+)
MLFKSKTVVSTPRTYAGSNEVFHRLWQRKLYLKTLKSVESSPADGKERISKSIGVGLLSDMDDGRSAWQGGYQQLPQSDTFPHPFLPQSLGRRDSSKQDRRDSSANQRGERRSRSAQQSRPGAMQPRNMKLPAMLPTQKPVQLRQKDKLVLLPRTQSEQATAEGGLMEAAAQRALSATEAEMTAAPPSSSIFSDIPGYDMPDSRGRVTVYCIAEALKLAELEPIILSRYPEATVNPYNEVLHLSLPFDAQQQPQQPQQNHIQQQQQQEPADCFFFEYGVVCFWGLSAKLEQEILNSIAKKAQQEPLPPREVEVDQFEYNYSTAAPPSMQNDTITISRHHANDHQVKLAICHALAQSTKLCVYEERVLELVFETKHLPQALAIHGTVHVTSQVRCIQLLLDMQPPEAYIQLCSL